MFINLTCNDRNLNKHQFENTPLWLRCKSNSSWFGNKTCHESISWKIDIDWELRWEYRLSHFPMDWYWLCCWCEPWVPDWVVSCETDTWEYRLSCIRIDNGYGIYVNLEFLNWVVSCETDTWEYRLSCILIDNGYGIYVNLEFLNWVVSCRTDTWEYRLSCILIDNGYGIYVNLEFLIELYLVGQIHENTD